MIERNPDLPDNILLLEPKPSFGEYARAYGDRLAEHYESNGVIVVPSVPIAFDAEYFQGISFTEDLKKSLGTVNGIEKSTITRDGKDFTVNESHPFVQLFGDVLVATYVQRQVAAFNARLRQGLSILFPRYLSLEEANITWRLTETYEEGLHVDVFAKGAPLPPAARSLHRLKVFINIDSVPRRWRTSLDLAGVLRACRGTLPDELPDDLNVVNDIVDKFDVLSSLPCHHIAYPTMSAVIANGETVSHEVVWGQRLVAGEFFCRAEDMLNPDKHSHRNLRRWLEDAGYRVAGDARAVAARYGEMKRSPERIKAARPERSASAAPSRP